MRYLKPGFKYQSGKSLVVEAGRNYPAFFIIGTKEYKISSNLECNLTINGPGGMAGSLALTANTIYYLYAVVSNGEVKLIADVSSPIEGLQQTDQWTYLGAFVTEAASPKVAIGRSNMGRYWGSSWIETSSHTGDLFLTPKTIKSPVTAKAALGMLTLVGSVSTNDFVIVSGWDHSVSDDMFIYLQATGVTSHSPFLEVSLSSPTTIYLRLSRAANTGNWYQKGWVENPSEYL